MVSSARTVSSAIPRLDRRFSDIPAAATSTPAPTTKKTKTTKGEKAKTPSATDNADDEEEGTKVKAQPDAVLDEDIFADGDFFT